MKITSLKQVCGKPETKVIELPEVGEVKIHDVGQEWKESLKRFYSENYRPTYPLINPEFFEWLFRYNNSCVSVISQKKKLLAHQGHVPIIFTNGIDDYPAFISASTMVDHNSRRKKLMSHLRGAVHDRYEMSSSLGGSDQGKKLYAYMGYRELGDLIRVIAVVDPAKCEGLAENRDNLYKTIKKISSASGNCKVRAISRYSKIEEELDSLWNKMFPPGTYSASKRSAEFLDWRYTEHPAFDYKRFGLWRNGILSAITVFRHEQVNSAVDNTCRIVELFGDPDSIVKLVSEAVLDEDTLQETAWIDWFCSNPNMVDPLKVLGFLRPNEFTPAVFPIFCSPVDYYKKNYTFMLWVKDKTLFEKLAPFDKWYITKGDGDADRPNNSDV